MGTSSTHLQAPPRLFVVPREESGLFSNLPALLTTVTIAWTLAMLPVLHTVWAIWISDPLRSIGMFFPLLSFALIARIWRRLGWECSGTWWGLLPLLLTAALLWLRNGHLVQVMIRPDFDINLLPEGPLLALSLSAGVLMIGGVRVWKKCLFPIALLLFVNPVPSAFNVLLDMPLQHASAGAARRFALLIGERPDGEQLRLMFTPDFGMFIAPGCNGIRGAVTLAYVALIVSYWRGFSIPVRLLSALAGLAMGYLFNFVRLCLLVVYYKVGRFVPAIQPHGALIDYLIGGSLFLFASVCFGLFFFRNDTIPAAPAPRPTPRLAPAANAVPLTLAFLAAITLIALLNLRVVTHDAREARLFRSHPEASVHLPLSVGRYHLANQWNEGDNYLWGRYSDGISADDVSLGLWIANGFHDALTCHIVRGEKTSTSELIVHNTPGAQASYRTFSYDDGLTTVFAASRVCPRCDTLGMPVRTFGRLQLIERPPDNFFGNSVVSGIALTHQADLPAEPSSAGYEPIHAFIAGLNESALLTPSTK